MGGKIIPRIRLTSAKVLVEVGNMSSNTMMTTNMKTNSSVKLTSIKYGDDLKYEE